MTAAERFLACMRYQSVDRPVLQEWGPWPTTLRRWQGEGLGAGNLPPQFAECDLQTRAGIDLWFQPPFEAKVLSENETSRVEIIDRGIVQRVWKTNSETSMPEFLEHPVKTRADWDALKPRLDPDASGRFPADWDERCRQWREQGTVVIFQGPRAPSLFGFVRELMGAERALCAMLDEPGMVHEMMDTVTELTLGVLRTVLPQRVITVLHFWEDMCYKAGPLLSPAMFREFMIPRYQRVTDYARSQGIDVIFVDSDGNVEQLLPLWLEAGVNGVYPMEVAAGMDVVDLRKRYGRDLLMTGGLDKRVLTKDKAAIDAELERKVPLAHEGGYVPTIDHAIPFDVPYDNFAYYWERKKELLGIG
ncbi:MAG: hypothetical protein AUJ96_27990 [Armatimonadetes bacterium CG2_30_66_41]|nr:hypothetical protein [Armatimonadota bacterium]OIO94821.1 MAG: hypothetical protein AUJ96_27990 [Armatimonadetes bacterium CG2_30_66_41]NCO92677.1 hypothetical protein [Armatimonadota bacterium]NCP28881.1 hypothetical protein [Armatimonadota bacterium]NCQ28513.1 hypothetical protein [Armatimonadota bacterium]